ncbi:MAG: conjugal transfer protein TraF [Gammaproteobacteria bacterium]|nr:conjugal transfer protein TraF [Gammaproteobacteria bacterium]NNL51107.1 conjugal transfer protein TraF [Woeseiaceae bacterium]
MSNLRPTVAVLLACCLPIASPPCLAATAFGIYDARTLAMGGASVASANNDNAQFYNSALLALNDEIEDRTADGRLLLPMLVPQVSDSLLDLEEINSEDLPGSISRAVREFNRTGSTEAAQAVVTSSETLDAYFAALEDSALAADLYGGMGVSEPGRFQGAGFFMGVRLLAGGATTITPVDRALLSDYQEALTFVATDGTAGTEHPELFDANGSLLDPVPSLSSTATATGAIVTEIGVAMSRKFRLFDESFAAGISLKVLDIEAFEDVERLADDRLDIDQNREPETHVNFDIGILKEFGDHWRVGLAVKDIIPHNYRTSLGTVIRMRPRPRIGVSYSTGPLQLAFDVDVVKNEPLGGEQPTQETAFGVEWVPGSLVRLRAGYAHDLRGNRDDIVSIGLGTRWKRLVIDGALAQGAESSAAALQFGIAF